MGRVTRSDVVEALENITPYYGENAAIPEDHVQVADGRNAEGWIEVRAEASGKLATEFSLALQEEIGGDVVVEPAGMGRFTVVDY
jgi:hypothetical protein